MGDLQAHGAQVSGRLAFQLEAVLLDDGIGEHLAGDAIDLRLGVFAADAGVERDLEVLALAQIVDTAKTHLLQGAVNGLALRIEDAFLQRNIDVGFHRKEHYSGDAVVAGCPLSVVRYLIGNRQ